MPARKQPRKLPGRLTVAQRKAKAVNEPVVSEEEVTDGEYIVTARFDRQRAGDYEAFNEMLRQVMSQSFPLSYVEHTTETTHRKMMVPGGKVHFTKSEASTYLRSVGLSIEWAEREKEACRTIQAVKTVRTELDPLGLKQAVELLSAAIGRRFVGGRQ